MKNTELTLTLTPGEGCFYVRDPAQLRRAAAVESGAVPLPRLLVLNCRWQRFYANTCEVQGGELRVYIPEDVMLIDADGVEHRGLWLQLHEGTFFDSTESTWDDIEEITTEDINALI